MRQSTRWATPYEQKNELDNSFSGMVISVFGLFLFIALSYFLAAIA